MAERLLRGIALRKCLKAPQQADKYQRHGESDDEEIAPDLLTAQDISPFADEQEIVEAEVAAEEYQEHGDDILGKCRKQLHAPGYEAEAACARAAEGGEQAEEEMLAFISRDRCIQHQYDDLKDCHAQIDKIEYARIDLHLGDKLADLRPRALCAKQMHRGAVVALRDEYQDKYQYTHAAYPVGEAPPEQRGVRHGGDIRDDAGSRGGKARHYLKPRIHVVRYIAVDDEGYRAEQRQHYPDQRRQGKALLLIQTVSLRLGYLKQTPQQRQHQYRYQKCQNMSHRLPVDEAHRKRRRHQKALQYHDLAQDSSELYVVHIMPLIRIYRPDRRDF